MKPLLETTECVLFDLDGTLVETNIDFPLMKSRMIELAVEHGITASKLQELDILAIVEASSEILSHSGKRIEAGALYERAMAVLEEIELLHAGTTAEIPFARELVQGLKNRGISVGVVTRNCRNASIMSLDMTGIVPDVLVCREDAAKRKPHPDQLHIAMRTLKARPERSVMVGDHLMDVLSGRAAGVKTIGLLRPERPEGFFDDVKPDLVVRNLDEVFHAIVDSDR